MTYNLGRREYNKTEIADQHGGIRVGLLILSMPERSRPAIPILPTGTSDNNEAIYIVVGADAATKNGISINRVKFAPWLRQVYATRIYKAGTTPSSLL